MTILFLVLISMAIVGGYLNSTSNPYNTMILLSAMAEVCLLYFIMTALPFYVRRKSPTVWKIKGKSICKWNILIGLLVLMIIDVIKMGGIYDKVFQNMGENLVYALMFYYINTRSLAKKKKSPDQKTDSTVTGNWDISGQDVMYVDADAFSAVPVSTAEIPVVPDTSSQNTCSEKKEKVRFCSKCGSLIDNQTKKCTGCGKQYFKGIRWKPICNIGVVLLLVASVAGNIVLYSKTAALNDTIVELEGKTATLRTRVDQLTEKETLLRNRNTNLESALSLAKSDLTSAEKEIDFYNEYVALVVDDGTRLYHKYSCDVLDDESFWCYGYSDSRFNQYKPCPACYDEDTSDFASDYWQALYDELMQNK